MNTQISILISYIIIFFAPLAVISIAGIFSERSGIINIALEGIMIFSSLVSLLTFNYLCEKLTINWLTIIITIIIAIVSGMLFSLLLAFAAIKFNANQTLIGIALQSLALSTAIVFAKYISPSSTSTISYNKEYFNLFRIGKIDINIFLIISIFVLLISWFSLYYLRFGLRLRSCGENPSAANSDGINVAKYRYIGVMISGALASIGSLAYIVPPNKYWNTIDGVSGFGFLAIAIMIFGAWEPFKSTLAAIFFSCFLSLSFCYKNLFYELLGIELNETVGVTENLFKIIPYLLTIIVLIFVSKKSYAPQASGQPYEYKK